VSLTGTQNDWETAIDRFRQACEAAWPDGQPRPRILTRGPARLDCMGGMADFSGCLALQFPLDRCAFVAAGPREDQRIRVQTLDWKCDGQSALYEWPLCAFSQTDGQILTH
jgi:hypothetical protein